MTRRGTHERVDTWRPNRINRVASSAEISRARSRDVAVGATIFFSSFQRARGLARAMGRTRARRECVVSIEGATLVRRGILGAQGVQWNARANPRAAVGAREIFFARRGVFEGEARAGKVRLDGFPIVVRLAARIRLLV